MLPSCDADAGEAVRVTDLLNTLERLAPAALAQPWDNCGLLVGDPVAEVRRVLVALELTDAVLAEAVAGSYDTVLTHHPLLFAPVRSLVESRPREKLLRRLVEKGMSLVACHTNLDAASGGLAEIAGEALGLQGMVPLESAPAGWYKLVGFVPPEAMEKVAAAVFAAGGSDRRLQSCAFSEGTGWFHGSAGEPTGGGGGVAAERTLAALGDGGPGAGWPRHCRPSWRGHPYEEPAFDIYPVEMCCPGGARPRGEAPQPLVRELAERAVGCSRSGRLGGAATAPGRSGGGGAAGGSATGCWKPPLANARC